MNEQTSLTKPKIVPLRPSDYGAPQTNVPALVFALVGTVALMAAIAWAVLP